MEEGHRDGPGDRRGADRVTETRPRGNDYVPVLGAGDGRRNTRTRPEREVVVRAFLGIRTALALTGAAYVDDVRTVRANIVDIDAQFAAYTVQLVGQEDVAGGGELVEDLQTLGSSEIEADAFL